MRVGSYTEIKLIKAKPSDIEKTFNLKGWLLFYHRATTASWGYILFNPKKQSPAEEYMLHLPGKVLL